MLAICRDLIAQGALAEAETRLVAILRTQPEDSEALTLLGATLVKAGRPKEGAEKLETALARDPDRVEALVWLGAAYRMLGRPEEAVNLLRRAVEITPDNAEALTLLGTCQLSLGRAVEAEEAFGKALQLQPQSAAAHANIGMARRLLNRGEEALASFQRARELEPERPGHHLQVFKQLQLMGRPVEAQAAALRGADQHPGSAILAEALAAAYGRNGQSAEAEAIFRRIAPSGPSGANAYAGWLQEEGRFDEAAAALRDSLWLQPLQGAPYRNLAEMGHDVLDASLALMDNPAQDDTMRMHLSYAIGRVRDRRGDFRGAMEAFDEANAIAYRIYPSPKTFDPVWTAREPDAIAELYTSEFFVGIVERGSPDARPIFIVGMVRSGTTLLDRILSAHPEIVATGEGTFWNSKADALHPRWKKVPPDEQELDDLAARYLSSVGDLAGRFTDKMPLNYRNLGPIYATFPNAQIVHIRRNPQDTAVSILQTYFAGGPNFAYNKGNLAAFYRSYLRHMAHWRAVLPSDRLFEFDYEALVEEPEGTTRAILSFLGLPWNDACLSHDQSPGPVVTPSRWQARQPIYRTSVGRGQAYAPWLGELNDL